MAGVVALLRLGCGCVVSNICGGGSAPPPPPSFESARVCSIDWWVISSVVSGRRGGYAHVLVPSFESARVCTIGWWVISSVVQGRRGGLCSRARACRLRPARRCAGAARRRGCWSAPTASAPPPRRGHVDIR